MSSPGQVPAASLPDLISMGAGAAHHQGTSHTEQSPSTGLPVTIHQPSLPNFIHNDQ